MPEMSLDGSVLIVSDIHATPQPLYDCLRAEAGVSARISLGDVVGYGSEPEEAVRFVGDFDLCIMGNHDRLAIGEADSLRFSRRALETYHSANSSMAWRYPR